MQQSSYLLKSRNHGDRQDTAFQIDQRNRLIEMIFDVLSRLQDTKIEEEKTFHDMFLNKKVHQHLADLISSMQRNDHLRAVDREHTIDTVKAFSETLKEYASQKKKIQIKINTPLHNIQRDTLRLVQEIYSTYQIIENAGHCGRDAIHKQLELQIKQLSQYSYFWENVSSLENRTPALALDQLKTREIQKQIDQWLQYIRLQAETAIIERPIEVEKPPTQSMFQENQLKDAHEKFCGLAREKDIESALQVYKELASKENVTALLVMGQIFEEGTICKQDYNAAFDYYQRSYQRQQNNFGIFRSCKLFLDGKVTQPFREHEMYLKRLSGSVNEGNSSQFAICLLKAAAEKGHLPSQLYLGDLYFEGKKLPDYDQPQDYCSSEIYYKQAKNQGCPEAFYKLGLLYLQMIKRDPYANRKSQIFKLFQNAKNLDYLPACYELAHLNLQGLEGELAPNPAMADVLFEFGALKGDKRCAKKIIYLRTQALGKGEYAFNDYLYFLDQLDEVYKSQPITYYYRGQLYQQGTHCAKDLSKALECFRRGAAYGCKKCQNYFLHNQAKLQELKDQDKDSVLDNNQTHSQHSSKPTSNGFISQLRQSEVKRQFKKTLGLSGLPSGQPSGQPGQKKSNFSNPMENDQSTIPERHTRMTISICKPSDQQNDRKRGQSDYTGLQSTQNAEVLLSQLKLQIPSPTNQTQSKIPYSQFGSPRQPTILSPVTLQSRKDISYFSRNTSHTSSKKYIYPQ